MNRRQIIAGLGAAAAWPLAARAQQGLPVIGYLDVGSPEGRGSFVAAFHQGLAESGYVEGHNVAIEYRWAEGHADRLPALAADLVRRPVAVIASLASNTAALAAKAAAKEIPIVFVVGVDPVAYGLVASLNRPGTNLTGVTTLNLEVVSKRLELLHRLAPTATALALLINPANPIAAATFSRDVGAAAQTLGLPLRVLRASTEREIGSAFETLAQNRESALLVANDALFNNRIDQIVGSAAKQAVPVSYGLREFVDAGGLMSYGGGLIDAHRLAGVYTGRVLGGEKPADLPVQQPTKFELVINIKTAKALGLSVPADILAISDEVIE